MYGMVVSRGRSRQVSAITLDGQGHLTSVPMPNLSRWCHALQALLASSARRAALPSSGGMGWGLLPSSGFGENRLHLQPRSPRSRVSFCLGAATVHPRGHQRTTPHIGDVLWMPQCAACPYPAVHKPHLPGDDRSPGYRLYLRRPRSFLVNQQVVKDLRIRLSSVPATFDGSRGPETTGSESAELNARLICLNCDMLQDAYDAFRNSANTWRMMVTLKRNGKVSLDGLKPGELVVPCPACPHPGVNMEDGWWLSPIR